VKRAEYWGSSAGQRIAQYQLALVPRFATPAAGTSCARAKQLLSIEVISAPLNLLEEYTMKLQLTVALAAAFTLGGAAFATPPQTKSAAVQITNGPNVEGVGKSWAVIAWTTNTGGSSVIHYGTDANNLSLTAQAPYSHGTSKVHQTHRVHLKNLKPGTQYFFQVDSGQGEGTGTDTKSPVQNFTTKGAAAAATSGEAGEAGGKVAVQIVDGPRVEGVGKDWAMIAWTTNTASSSVIHYGTDQNNLSQTAQSPYADVESKVHQTHRVKVTKLQPNTTYYFMVDSGQGEGTGTDAKSQVQNFKTKAK